MKTMPVSFAAAELIQHLLQPLAQIVLLENSSMMTEHWRVSTIVSTVAQLAVPESIQGQHRHHVLAARLERTWQILPRMTSQLLAIAARAESIRAEMQSSAIPALRGNIQERDQRNATHASQASNATRTAAMHLALLELSAREVANAKIVKLVATAAPHQQFARAARQARSL